MIKDFKDKIVVITGAAYGIGRSLAFSFAKRGCKLAIAVPFYCRLSTEFRVCEPSMGRLVINPMPRPLLPTAQ